MKEVIIKAMLVEEHIVDGVPHFGLKLSKGTIILVRKDEVEPEKVSKKLAG